MNATTTKTPKQSDTAAVTYDAQPGLTREESSLDRPRLHRKLTSGVTESLVDPFNTDDPVKQILQSENSFFKQATRPVVRDAVQKLHELIQTRDDVTNNGKEIMNILEEINTQCVSLDSKQLEYLQILEAEGLHKPLIRLLTLCKELGYLPISNSRPKFKQKTKHTTEDANEKTGPDNDNTKVENEDKPDDDGKAVVICHDKSAGGAKRLQLTHHSLYSHMPLLVSCTALLMTWNATPEGTFGGILSESGLIDLTIEFLTEERYIRHINHRLVGILVLATLNIYQNAVRRVPDVKYLYHEHKVVELLQKLQGAIKLRPSFNAVVYMMFAHLMTDKQLATMDETDTIVFMIRALEKTLTSEDKKYYMSDPVCEMNFIAEEFAYPLCAMSVNDKNKYAIVENNGLSVLLLMLNGENADEQALAAKTVWNLSFDDRAKEAIITKNGLIEKLEALKDSSKSATVRKLCKGALWKISGEKQHKSQSMTDRSSGDGHIMISYSHAHQLTVSKVKDLLTKDGYKVWMDVDQMSGSTLEAMAKAIESAVLVLICASEQYKDSPSCRTEGEYAFQLKKPIVPLMLQRRYRPDGWLGMLMGSKLYINFDGKFDLNKAYDMLKAEIRKILKPQVPGDDVIVQTAASLTGALPHRASSGLDSPDLARPRTPQARARVSSDVTGWSQERVQQWLRDSNLTMFGEEFAEYDGQLLTTFSGMIHTSPDFVYSQLAKTFKLQEIVRLKHEIDKLCKK